MMVRTNIRWVWSDSHPRGDGKSGLKFLAPPSQGAQSGRGARSFLFFSAVRYKLGIAGISRCDNFKNCKDTVLNFLFFSDIFVIILSSSVKADTLKI